MPPIAPPMDTSLIRAPAASRNSTGPRASPVATCAVVPWSAWRIRPASSPGSTPAPGRTPMALTRPSRAASRCASVSLKNRVVWCPRLRPAVAAIPLTV